MTDAELGQATIVYETPDGETVEQTVDNEHLAYFQDHWIVRMEERADGTEVVRRIPMTRVYHVERNVEAFEEEIETLRDQVQSFATDLGGEVSTLRERIESVAGGLQRGDRSDADAADSPEADGEPIEIAVGEETEDSDATSAGSDQEESTPDADEESNSSDGEIDRSL